MRIVPESPRLRRRFIRIGAALAVGLVIAIVFVLLPTTNGNVKSHFTNAPVQRVISQRQVPVTRARRREVNRLFDAFVPAAVERRDPRLAYGLVTPGFRAGVSKAAWLRGNLPVYPYAPRGKTFHGWTVDTSYPTTMSVELYLQPRHPKDGPVSVNVDLSRQRGRWLIDSFYPRASYAPSPTSATASSASAKKTAAPSKPVSSDNPHGNLILVVLAVFIGVVIGTPVLLLAGTSFRGRARRRRSDA